MMDASSSNDQGTERVDVNIQINKRSVRDTSRTCRASRVVQFYHVRLPLYRVGRSVGRDDSTEYYWLQLLVLSMAAGCKHGCSMDRWIHSKEAY